MNVETHSFMDGKVHIYKRDKSKFWQCSTYMDGCNHRVSTKEESLTMAKEFAREWYMAAYVDIRRRNHYSRVSLLLGKFGVGGTALAATSVPHTTSSSKASNHTFSDAAKKFIAEYGIITEGQRNKEWTAYSLRHTYICLRLMEGADIYQIAKNCRTSAEMIEQFYAAHLKNTLDASAINVRKPKKKRKEKNLK